VTLNDRFFEVRCGGCFNPLKELLLLLLPTDPPRANFGAPISAEKTGAAGVELMIATDLRGDNSIDVDDVNDDGNEQMNLC
jgi:hypothetical protein